MRRGSRGVGHVPGNVRGQDAHIALATTCAQSPRRMSQCSHWVTYGHFLDVSVKINVEPNGGIFDVST